MSTRCSGFLRNWQNEEAAQHCQETFSMLKSSDQRDRWKQENSEANNVIHHRNNEIQLRENTLPGLTLPPQDRPWSNICWLDFFSLQTKLTLKENQNRSLFIYAVNRWKSAAALSAKKFNWGHYEIKLKSWDLFFHYEDRTILWFKSKLKNFQILGKFMMV